MTMFGSQWFAAPSVAAYEIDNSCIFNDNDSPYLSKTLGTATDANRWTYSTWLKRGNIGTSYPVIVSAGSGGGDTDRGDIVMTTDNEFQFSGGTTIWRKTTQKFRDITAWYHLVVAVNTDESGNDMIKIYINGSQITAFATTNNPSGAANTGMNTAIAHNIGRQTHGSDGWWDGYMSEINFIDGQQLTPASFGETNDEGVWIPTEFSGTYGDNGFFLEFGDSSALGDDTSGETNDWATSGLTASDQCTDTPTNNFCTVNPIYRGSNSTASAYGVTTQGNLGLQYSGSADGGTLCTQMFPTGKFYWEIRVVAGGNSANYDLGGGIADAGGSYTRGTERMRGIATGEIGFNSYNGEVRFSNSVTKTYSEAPFVDGDIIGVAADATNGAIYYSKNGTFMGSGSPTSGASKTNAGATWTASSYTGWVPTGNVSGGSTPKQMFNFGQNGTFNGTITAGGNSDGNGVGDFKYSVPSGYLALCSNNLEAPALKDGSTNFQAVTYSGTGSSNAITFGGNADMQPDVVIIKQRNSTRVWTIYDAPRGVNKYVQLNEADAESDSSLSLTAFGSDGFTVGSGAWVNVSGGTFLGYGWSAGNSGASNENGTINTTTTYSDSTAGISVSTYTGTGSAATIGHGLGVAPKLIMVKNRSAADAWKVYHAEVASDPQTDYLVLNTNAAKVDDATVWNDTAPTSTVFSIGTHTDVNTNTETYVAYAFAEVAGFSKFSIFTGNANADGPFIYTGFKPAWVMLKRTDSSDNWVICDNKRSTYNPAALRIYPDTTNADISSTTLDFISSGFKMRASDGGVNGSGGSYICMAFAESPFGGDGASPATAK